jgi:hypothetical protein
MSTPNFTDFEYYISYRAAGSGELGWVETNQPATVHPFIISGLAPGTTYEFRVRKRRKTTGFSKFSTSLTATMSNTESSTTTGTVAVYSATNTTGVYSSESGGVTTTRTVSNSVSSVTGDWNYALLDYTSGATSYKLAVMNTGSANGHYVLGTEQTSLGYQPGNAIPPSTSGNPVLAKSGARTVQINLAGTFGFTVTLVFRSGSKTATVIYFPPLPA